MGSDNAGVAFSRKTPFQREALEASYAEDKYPSHEAMEDFARSLKLTYKQVRGWFIEKRRRDKRAIIDKQETTSSSKSNRSQLLPSKKNHRSHSIGKEHHVSGDASKDVPGYMNKSNSWRVKKRKTNQTVTPIQHRKLPVDLILKKVFRKDGPALGVEFDSLPAGAFHQNTKGPTCPPTCISNERLAKKRKVAKVSNFPLSCSEVNTKRSVPIVKHGVGKGLMIDNTKRSIPVVKHGMGKGLMTAWCATTPGAGGYSTGVELISRETAVRQNTVPMKLMNPSRRKVKNSHRKMATKQGTLRNKVLEKRKRAIRNAKVSSKIAEKSKKPPQSECKLALEGMRSQEYPSAIANLVDDEELELRELQAGPNPPSCSEHLAFNGVHRCSLCKDLLARFPPRSLKMKQPLCMRPWSSSLELVKKLLKVFRFLYTHSILFHINPFTLDEFAQAFQDKGSLLLGEIHVALLKVLFSDVEMELSGGFIPHISKNYRFIGFLDSVKQQERLLKLWSRYLNPITWTEILRQVLVAAGFNSKQSKFRGEALDKDDNHLAKYGLRSGTLKGEIFSILSEQGNNGLRVSELAKDSRVMELHHTNTKEELELLICSALSSDITLFEKISPTAYRLRINCLTSIGMGDYQSDSDDSGSVDGAYGDITNSSDEYELDSVRNSLSIVKHNQHYTKKSNISTEDNEIDESDSGVLWVLALMEGEYSELSLEEKLDTLVALVDLTSAGSSIRVETQVSITEENISSVQHHGGGKIKRSIANNLRKIPNTIPPRSSERMNWTKKSDFLGPNGSNTKDTEIEELELDGHRVQSIHLGSDRRFNSYWLFLGPCNSKDPGHKRIYFESSEDGHWEVIDSSEALCSLLSVLDDRGSREACLLTSLRRFSPLLCEAMSTNTTNDNDVTQSTHSDQSCIDIVGVDGSSPISDVDNNTCVIETVTDSFPSSRAIGSDHRKVEEQRREWERLQEFDVWIWKSFYSNLHAVKNSKRSYLESLVRCSCCHDLYWRDEKHCKICHTTFELDFNLEEIYAIHVATCREKEDTDTFPRHRVLSTQLQSLKAALHAIEGVMPKEALVSAWTTSHHKLWATRLRRTSTLSEFLQVLTDFVGAIDEDWVHQCNKNVDCDTDTDTTLDEIVESFTRIPQTTSAVALWLVKLDDLIASKQLKTQTNRITRQRK